MTFGMAPWHIIVHDRSKDALVSQSPMVVFKSCNMLQALGVTYSRIGLPSSDVKARPRERPTAPLHGTMHINGSMQPSMLMFFASMSRMHSKRYCS